jgi:antitoxin component YwqK of YwqJK toxin-antitoxin module
LVQDYDHGLAHGLWTGFHSGRIRSQGVYSNNVRVGVWVRYSGDGSTNYVKDYSKP